MKTGFKPDKNTTDKNLITMLEPIYARKYHEDSYSGKPLNLAEYNIINQLLCVDKVHYKGVVYESKNEKIKKLIPSLVIFTMTLLIFLLLYNGQPKTNEKT